MLARSIYCAALIAATRAASPLKLTVNRHISPNFVGQTLQRNEALQAGKTIPIFTGGASGYYTSVQVGDQVYTGCLLDSGSSVTFVHPYTPSKTAQQTQYQFTELFGDNTTASGTFVVDTFSFYGSGMTPAKIYVAGEVRPGVTSPRKSNGLIGLGPQLDLQGLISNPAPGSKQIAPVLSELVKAGTLPANIIGLGFHAYDLIDTEQTVDAGAVTFGGFDSSVLTSEITWSNTLPIYQTEKGQALWWAVSLELPSFGLLKSNKNRAWTIIDSGTTLTVLYESVFHKWFSQIKGAVIDKQAPMPKIPLDNIDSIPALDFTLEGQKFTIPGKELLLPPAFVKNAGLDPHFAWAYITTSGSDSGIQIFGAYSLTKLYVILDEESTTRRVGFARTKATPVA
ncbi:hypothetical protein E5Q_04727 [Mixia osmundae IAM 14324]|uniref:Peptidase A1 domain-containing protein n=1 Tax=Mixia osmundae (strain CBS 9802 / IAM 14324 / JCM 22182 / KY 12970) TaxID=764103 RepID=G7E5D7_MIXOS|nr:hypothetical protein E5Q_04727 [Mixia osmundae IAM 14324]